MNIKRLENNPYQTPACGQVEKRSSRKTGFSFLVGGSVAMICSIILIFYLMIEVVPEIKDYYDARNLNMEPNLIKSVQIVDFFVRYWLAWPIIFIALILRNEIYAPIKYRWRFRKRFGILIGCVALLSAVWMLWIAIRATP